MVQSNARLLVGKLLPMKLLLVDERLASYSAPVMRVELMTPKEFVSTHAVVEQAAQLSEQEFQLFSFILARRACFRNLKAPWLCD